MTDFSFILLWWLLLSVTGLTFLPLTSLLFPVFHDKGYAFSKIIGVILVSYLVYVVGTLRLIPFSYWTIAAAFVVLGSISLFYIPRTQLFKKSEVKSLWKIFLFEELLFFAGLWLWVYVRSFNPEIFGLEKYMDFGFVNSILRSDYFPPKDMWFTPLPINYYYFGHLMTAVLTKISGISPFITYNLMLASILAFCLSQTFSIGLTLWKHAGTAFKPLRTALFVGLLTACLVSFSGNLHVLYAFFKPYDTEKPVPIWNLEFSLFNTEETVQTKQITDPKTGLSQSVTYTPLFVFPNGYWYPNATRFIYNTIHEFPMYSWVVADLHGHVLDIPIVLLTIGFLLSIFLVAEQKHSLFNMQYATPIIIGFLLALMYMTNAWDSLTYLMLAGLILFYLQWERVQKEKAANTTHNPILPVTQLFLSKTGTTKLKHFFLKHGYADLFTGLFTYLLIIFSSYLIFSLPFSAFFNPSQIVSGVGVLCSPKFMFEQLKNGSSVTEGIRKIGPFLFEADHCQKSPWWQLLILYGFFYFFVLSFLVFLMRVKKWARADVFVMLLILASTILIIIPEFLYMKDIYPAHYRANTMFKLVFQAFIMLSIASGYITVRVVSSIKYRVLSMKTSAYKVFAIIPYTLYAILTTSLLTLVFTYPFLATKSYYGELKEYQGLNGVTYLQKRHVADYEGIMWLQKHVSGQPVILEAQGDSYTDFARVSANTGLPTVLGWTVHEWLWRGTYDIPSPRISEVQTLYETTELGKTKQLLEKYRIEYIFVGDLEREKYTALQEDKFNRFGKKVFEMGTTRIYQIGKN